MAGTVIKKLALTVVMAVAISGCENAPNPFAGKDNSETNAITTEAATSVRLVDRDVEAPEVFQTTDAALWDGRPSLGGVWVASPDAVNPERVIIRNEANGKFVIGALFRRERDNPGPKLQISSDAADALGMLAGQPGQLNVTALRREESNTEVAEAAPAAASPTPEDADAAPKETLDPIAAAGAAIDRVDGAAADSVAEGVDISAEATAPLDDLDPTPREGETKRAARKRARLAAKAAAAAESAVLTPEAGPVLDAPLAEAPAVEVAPLSEAAPATAPAPSGGSTRIQIGIFSVEANAQRAADTLTKGGIAANVRKEESNGKTFWSVVATGSGDSASLLAKVKALGFVDAYAVSG